MKLVLEKGDSFTLITKHQVVVCKILAIRERNITTNTIAEEVATAISTPSSLSSIAEAVRCRACCEPEQLFIETKERLVRAAPK